MPPVIVRHAIPHIIGRWRDMPLSALLCLVDLCFLTIPNHHYHPLVPRRNTTMIKGGMSRPGGGMMGMGRPGGMGMVIPMMNNTGEMPGGSILTRFGADNMTLPDIAAENGTAISTATGMTVTTFGPPSFSTKRISSMTERLDALDIDAILKNQRLFNSYLKCMLETGPCTAEGKEMKREVIEVLHTGCADCTEKTKTRLKKSFLRMKSDPKFRESYKMVLNKYDPEKKYIQTLEKFLA